MNNEILYYIRHIVRKLIENYIDSLDVNKDNSSTIQELHKFEDWIYHSTTGM